MPKKKQNKKKYKNNNLSEDKSDSDDKPRCRRRVNSLCKHNRKINSKSGTFKDPNFGIAGIDSYFKPIRIMKEVKHKIDINPINYKPVELKNKLKDKYLSIFKRIEDDFILKYNSLLLITNRDIYLSNYSKVDDKKYWELMRESISQVNYEYNLNLKSNFDLYRMLYYYIKYYIIDGKEYNLSINLGVDAGILRYYTNYKLRINYYDLYNVFKTYSLNTTTITRPKYKQIYNNLDKQFISLENFPLKEEFDYRYLENFDEVKYLFPEDIQVINNDTEYIKNTIINYYKDIKNIPKNIYEDPYRFIMYENKKKYIMKISYKFCEDFIYYSTGKFYKLHEYEEYLYKYLKDKYKLDLIYNNDKLSNESFKKMVMVNIYNFKILNTYQLDNYKELSKNFDQIYDNFLKGKYRFYNRLCIQNLYEMKFNEIDPNYIDKFLDEKSKHISNMSIIKYYKSGDKYKVIKLDIYKRHYNMILNKDNNENNNEDYYLEIGNIYKNDMYYNTNICTINKINTNEGNYELIMNNNSCITNMCWNQIYNNKTVKVVRERTDNFTIFEPSLKLITRYNTIGMYNNFIYDLLDYKYGNQDDTINKRIIYWNKYNIIQNYNFFIPGKIYDPYIKLLYNYKRENNFKKYKYNDYIVIDENKMYYTHIEKNISIYYNNKDFSYNIINVINNKNIDFIMKQLDNEEILRYKHDNKYNIVHKLRLLKLIPHDLHDYIDFDIQKINKYYLAYCLNELHPLNIDYYLFLYKYKSLHHNYNNYNEYNYHFYNLLNDTIKYEEYIKELKDNNEYNKVDFVYHLENNLYIQNMLIINLVYFKGINNMYLMYNYFEFPHDIEDILRIEYNIIYRENNLIEKKRRYDKYYRNKIQPELEKDNNFKLFYNKYSIYYKFLSNYKYYKSEYILKDFVDYIKYSSNKESYNEIIKEEIKHFTLEDFNYLKYDINDLYNNKKYKCGDIFHKDIILNIKKMLKSSKYKNMYNALYSCYPYKSFNSIYRYWFYKNFNNLDNINSYQDIRNVINNYSYNEKKIIYGKYKSYKIKNYYLKENYNYNFAREYRNNIIKFNRVENCNFITIEIGNITYIFNKPRKPYLALPLFFNDNLKNYKYKDDKTTFQLFEQGLKKFKCEIEKYEKAEQLEFELYLENLYNFEEYGYFTIST